MSDALENAKGILSQSKLDSAQFELAGATNSFTVPMGSEPSRVNTSELKSDQDLPKISVLLTTYTAHLHLSLCVVSLARISAKEKAQVEVIVFGDGGGTLSEKTISECKKFLSEQGIRCIEKYSHTNLGIVGALNMAALMASYPWLYIINDDMVFPKNWYFRIASLLTRNRVLSTSALEPLTQYRKPARCFRAANLGLDPTKFDLAAVDKLQIESELEVGVNYPFVVEKELFEKVEGADPAFPGPYHDPDLFHRLRLEGAELVRTQNLAPYHFSGLSLRQQNQSHLPSLNWVKKENEARMVFIRKWGCKPKARFGELPRLTATRTWALAQHTVFEKLRLEMLILWEQLRANWRVFILRLRKSI